MVTPQEQWYVSTKSVIGLFPVLLHSPEILFIISYFNPVISWWSKDINDYFSINMACALSAWHTKWIVHNLHFQTSNFLSKRGVNKCSGFALHLNVINQHFYDLMWPTVTNTGGKDWKSPTYRGHVTPIQVLLRAVHKKFTKHAVTLTTQKSPLGTSWNMSHTHIGLP